MRRTGWWLGAMGLAGAAALASGGCGPFEYEDAGAAGGDGHGGAEGVGNEQNVCTPGTQLPCYSGPIETAGVGVCRQGLQTCNADGMGFGACEGEVTPKSFEDPDNSTDDDCNGTMLVGGEHLIAQYLINEDPSNKPGVTRDSIEPPTDLNIITSLSDPTLSVSQDAPDHRGLTWTHEGSSSLAMARIKKTKILDKLYRAEGVTIEVVTRFKKAKAWSRAFALGYIDGADATDALSLMYDGDPLKARLYWNGVEAAQWDVDPVSESRRVLHLVVDTKLDNGMQSSLYVDGEKATASSVGHVDMLDLHFTDMLDPYLCLGTRPLGGSSPKGTLYYAAIYDTALSLSEIRNNAARLRNNDDHP